MKLIISISLLLLSNLIYGQTYKSLIAQADSLYLKNDYQNSVLKFKEAFKIEQKNGQHFYNAGCAASLSNDSDLAFKWLNIAIKNGWANIKHLKVDADLNNLHKNKKWDKLLVSMQKEVDKIEKNYDKPLQAKLITIFDNDQIIRVQYIAVTKEFGYESKQADSLLKIMRYKDSVNLIAITEILDKKGWVGVDKIGGQANQTLFLVIQHADLKTQQKYLPMMREAVKKKNASANSLALLEDRVALGEGKRQIYGSQIGYDSDSKTNYVLPLEDPEQVDKRRAEVGLGLISEYVKRWDIIWDVEAYKKLLPEIEAKEAQKK